VSLPTSALADLVRAKVAERGFYAVNWGRPLLYPGPTDLAAFGWDGSLELLPRTKRWSRGIVGLPTDVGPVQARELAQMVLALVAGKSRESMAASAVRGESPVAHKPANLALVRTEDDVRARLVPVCVGGDLLACKKVTETYFLQWGRCYVILTRSQGAMVKRVQPSDKDGYIKCVSDNTRYAPFDVPMEDIVSVALVNGSISLE
jgi:hypothetical protein